MQRGRDSVPLLPPAAGAGQRGAEREAAEEPRPEHLNSWDPQPRSRSSRGGGVAWGRLLCLAQPQVFHL